MDDSASFYGRRRPKVNSLLSIWYGLLVGALNVYLIVQSVKRFVWLAELSWPYQKTPFIELNAYIALTGVAVLLLPFFLAASFLKIGNTSNDNEFLGEDFNNEHEREIYRNIETENSNGFFRTMWKHGSTTASFLHIVSSFSLLLPQTIMEAVLAKYGHLPQDTIWRTDLDFMLTQRDRNFVLSIISTGDLKNEQFESTSGTFMMNHTPGVISIEYLNFALALIVFSVRYPSVFWQANKTFGFVFSAQLIINAIHSLISYSCFTVLYKLHVVGPAEVLHKTPRFLLNNHVTLLLYVISAITLFVSSGVFYHYGYLRIVSFARNKARTQHITDSNQSTRYGPGWAYFPHCSALAVLLSLAATQSPVVYDASLLYKISLDNCILTFITSSAIHMLFWILLWLWLTAKTKWNFQIKVTPACADGKLKNLEYKRSVAEIVRTDSCRAKRVMFSTSTSDNEQKYDVLSPTTKSNGLETLGQANQLKDNWPGPCQENEKQHFLEPEENHWSRGPNFNADFLPSRNRVTFQDTIPSPRYECAPSASRQGGLKRTTCDDDHFQEDMGEYAMLRNGPPLTRTSSIRNKPETVEYQRVPASVSTTDSGYSGGGDSVSRADSRSTTGSRSPSYRQMSIALNPPPATNTINQLFDFTSDDQHSIDYSPYGKLGLVRKESIRSTVNPIYEEREKLQQPIYESRKIQPLAENPYEAHHLMNKSIPNESYTIHVNDLINPIYGFSKQSGELSTVSNSAHTDYYGINPAQKLQELEKTLLKTSDHNLQRDSIKIPKRNNSFRQIRACEPASDVSINSLTNKLISFEQTSQRTPPIPPPLPPLSFLGCQRNGLMTMTPFSRPTSTEFGNNSCYTPLA